MSDKVSSPSSRSAPMPAALRALPPTIWALGLGSMCMDVSSELIHSLLPVFLATVLGTSMLTIGIVEGVAEATAAITRVFSGALSDVLGQRKLPLVLGYAVAALTKPVFPLASTVGWVFAARFVDRVGKGIRGAPRDALVADIAPTPLRGAAYGLRQALDSVGALLGPLLALGLMASLAGDIRAVMWAAVPPAFVAVTLLVVFVHEPRREAHGAGEAGPTLAGVTRLPLRYWLVVLLGVVFTLARFSEAFLVLRGQEVGLAAGQVPMVMAVMNAVYALLAYPAGVAADRVPPRPLLLGGLAPLIAADLLLAAAVSPRLVFVGAALWGAHMALTQGLFAKLVADAAPALLRGTAFGVFNLGSGGALLAASVLAGGLWSALGASATFVAGAVFAATAAAGLIAYGARSRLAAADAGHASQGRGTDPPMSETAPYFRPPSPLERFLNRAVGAAVLRGLGPSHMKVLEVRGRRSGRLYRVPVDPLVTRGAVYLVAPRGHTQWVRNAQAAGEVTLRRGRDAQAYRLRALAGDDKLSVLAAYLQRFRREVQRYFPVPAGSPPAALQPWADRYPAFELVQVDQPGPGARP